jgi:hypothetical protein
MSKCDKYLILKQILVAQAIAPERREFVPGEGAMK